jgi:sugar phosphate isomerase/epimerase
MELAGTKIALSAWSFHEALLSGRMQQREVPGAAARLGFAAVEMLDILAAPLPAGRWTGVARRGWHALRRGLPFLPHQPRPPRPKQYSPAIAEPLRRAADSAGVRVVSWTLDTDLTAEGAALEQQRAYWERGVETARALGCEVLRVTTGGRDGDGRGLRRAQANLQQLVEMAAGLRVAVENHWGLSRDPALLVALLEAVPGAGCCLDFGNWDDRIRNEAIRMLAPFTTHVHAKSFGFDANGNEANFDYRTIVGRLTEAGYEGWYVVEYEGDGPPETAIQQTRRLLERVIEGGVKDAR